MKSLLTPIAYALLATVPATAVMAQQLHEAHVDAGVECSACHAERPASLAPPQTTCIACHGTMLDSPRPVRPLSPDPHADPHLAPGEVPVCSDCHKVHDASEVTCLICHRRFRYELK